MELKYGCNSDARKDPPGTSEPIAVLDSIMSGQRQILQGQDEFTIQLTILD